MAEDCNGASIQDYLTVSVGTVYNTCKVFFETGSVEPRKPDRTNARMLSQYDEMLVIQLIMESPSLYLGEMCHKINILTGISVNPSTICRLLHRDGLTRKKIQQVASQRNGIFRGDFMAEMQFFNVDQLVWLDETGCNNRDHIKLAHFWYESFYDELSKLVTIHCCSF